MKATLEHISKDREVHKKTVEEIDNLISGGYQKKEIIELKEIVTKMFQESGFTLRKWYTNCSIESHENYCETMEHQFTNQITTKSQRSQAETLDDVLTI